MTAGAFMTATAHCTQKINRTTRSAARQPPLLRARHAPAARRAQPPRPSQLQTQAESPPPPPLRRINPLVVLLRRSARAAIDTHMRGPSPHRRHLR